jgi:hypothetical protein
MPTIRTATIASGLELNLVRLADLFTANAALAARTRHYDDVIVENTGDAPLYFATVDDNSQTPTNADRKTLGVGQQKTFDEIDTHFIFFSTSDIGVTSVLEFEGKPVFRGL